MMEQNLSTASLFNVYVLSPTKSTTFAFDQKPLTVRVMMSCVGVLAATMLRAGPPRLGRRRWCTTMAMTKQGRRRGAQSSSNSCLHHCFCRNQRRRAFIEDPQIFHQLKSPYSSHCSSATHFSTNCLNNDEDIYDASSSTPEAFVFETLDDEIRHANERYAQRIVVCEDKNVAGWGVQAACDLSEGSVLLVGRSTHPDPHHHHSTPITRRTTPDAHTIQVQRDTHVRMDLPARFLNHACGSRANVGVRRPTIGTASHCATSNNTDQQDDGSVFSDNQGTVVYEFVAKRNIAAGESLCYDYETTEWSLQSPFECSCGSPDCRGTIVGFGLALARGGQQHPLLQQQYRPWMASHLWEMMEEELEKHTASGRFSKTVPH